MPEWLYVLNPSTASGQLVRALGNGSEGETLFNPDDGFLYHASGLGVRNNASVGEVLEKVHLGTLAVTNVPLSGFDYQGLSALFYSDGAFFGADLGALTRPNLPRFFRITSGGVVTFLGAMDHVSKGFAEPGPAPVPALARGARAALGGLMLVVVAWMSGRRRVDSRPA